MGARLLKELSHEPMSALGEKQTHGILSIFVFEGVNGPRTVKRVANQIANQPRSTARHWA